MTIIKRVDDKIPSIYPHVVGAGSNYFRGHFIKENVWLGPQTRPMTEVGVVKVWIRMLDVLFFSHDTPTLLPQIVCLGFFSNDEEMPNGNTRCW
jgi:hypothetical protein